MGYVIAHPAEVAAGRMMNYHSSVEGQATHYNADFWKYYNAPVETSKDSKIIEELQGSALLRE